MTPWRPANTLRLATWNVNSLKARLSRVLEWLEYAQPDILCLQETKLAPESFPTPDFEVLGYECAVDGQGQWNGVAVLSRVGLAEVRRGFDALLLDKFAASPGAGDLVPASTSGQEGEGEAVAGRLLREARIVSARCGVIQVASVYVPNGRALDDPHYQGKLVWLEVLRRQVEADLAQGAPLVVAGDFNIAPTDADVYSPPAFEGATHVSGPERQALARIHELGLKDVFRDLYPAGRLYTWWDYRGGSFHLGKGLRIDLVLASDQLAERAVWAVVDREARKIRDGKQPSDHAPVIVDFDLSGLPAGPGGVPG